MIEGRLYHVGVAVHDVDRTIEQYRKLLGIERWAITGSSYDADWRGARSRVEARVAFAPWGPLYLELVEGGTGGNPARDWLDTHGEGVHHVGYAGDTRQRPDGSPACFTVLDNPLADGSPMAVYLDTVDRLGYYVELVDQDRATQLCSWVDATTATGGQPAPGDHELREG